MAVEQRVHAMAMREYMGGDSGSRHREENAWRGVACRQRGMKGLEKTVSKTYSMKKR